MAIKRRSKAKASFSMSSMTDIVFLLLIFFMITSTLVHPNAIKLLIPRKAQQNESVKEFTQVRITQKGTYYIDGKRTSSSDLVLDLNSAMQETSKDVIKLTTDKNVETGLATIVLDVAETHGYKVILDIK